MAGKSAMPLLLMAGAAAVMLGGKKRKSSGKTNAGRDGDPGTYVPSGPVGEVPDDTEEYVPYTPSPKPKPAAQTSNRPSGNPPGGSSYDGEYWGSDSEARMTKIRDYFIRLGYQVTSGPWPMNVLGPKGAVELTNEPGSVPEKGMLGGKDDADNPIVKLFQKDYNTVSRLNNADKIYTAEGGKMGGLDKDGMVGPYTLNGLRYAVDNLPGGKTWPQLLQQATLKGVA
jgi:hypothetical protein